MDNAKGYLILPLKIEEMSEINADVVASGPAPSPWIILWPTGFPSTITAFSTPLIPAMYEVFLIKLGWTLWVNLLLLISDTPINLIL